MRLRLAAGLAWVAAVVVAAPVCAQQRPFEEVVAQLTSPDPGARLAALRLFAESGYPEAGPPIAALLKDPEEKVQREALFTELGLYLGPGFASRKRVAFLHESRDAYAAERAFDAGWGAVPLEPVPLEVLTGLVTPMRSPKADLRIEATYAVGVLGQVDGRPDPGLGAVVDALAERLGDPEPAGRVAAARAAGRVFRRCPAPCAGVGLERLGDALVHSLNDPDVLVQMAAMESLGQLRYTRGLQAVTVLYDYYKRDQPALVALDAISLIGHASSLPVLRAALGRKELDARRAGIEGLGRIGDKEALDVVDALPTAKRSPNEVLAIAFAQQRSGRAARLEALVAAASEDLTRVQAQDYLVELGAPAAPAVTAGLTEAPPAGRTALLEVLAMIGGRDQVRAVEPYVRDRDRRVAAAADRAVRRMGRR